MDLVAAQAEADAALALADDELGGEIGGVPLEPRVLRLAQRLALAPLLRLRRGPGRVAISALRPLQSLRLLALLELQLGASSAAILSQSKRVRRGASGASFVSESVRSLAAIIARSRARCARGGSRRRCD